MIRRLLKSKIHRATVTEADLNYEGSITIDESLMNAANLIEGEKVSIVNINNGERLDTYVIKGQPGSGEITLNGPAARKVQAGDIIIIIAFSTIITDIHEAFVYISTNNTSLAIYCLITTCSG